MLLLSLKNHGFSRFLCGFAVVWQSKLGKKANLDEFLHRKSRFFSRIFPCGSVGVSQCFLFGLKKLSSSDRGGKRTCHSMCVCLGYLRIGRMCEFSDSMNESALMIETNV